MTAAIDFNKYSVSELLELQVSVIEELNKRNVLRSQNNPTGDYADYLAVKHLSLSLEDNTNAGFDARDAMGNRFQIKGRRVTSGNPSRQLGVFRNLEDNRFDFLVGIIFDKFYSVNNAVKIPFAAIKEYAIFSKHQNGYILHLSGSVLQDERVETITGKFKQP